MCDMYAQYLSQKVAGREVDARWSYADYIKAMNFYVERKKENVK